MSPPLHLPTERILGVLFSDTINEQLCSIPSICSNLFNQFYRSLCLNEFFAVSNRNKCDT